VSLALPYLENPEPLIAEIAYGELAAAPYGALLTAKPRLAAPAIRRWLADSKLAARRPLYLLLLGIAGDASDAAQIERRLDAAWPADGAAYIGSLIAADVQLRGPARMPWVEAEYLLNARRSPLEVEAALLALSVLGNANSANERERIIASYRKFMRARPDIAGYVARDFAAWGYWDAVPEYVALMKSSVRQQYPSRLAIIEYLHHSPNAQNLDLDLSPADAHALGAARIVPIPPQ
jgi:hypothetical protein